MHGASACNSIPTGFIGESHGHLPANMECRAWDLQLNITRLTANQAVELPCTSTYAPLRRGRIGMVTMVESYCAETFYLMVDSMAWDHAC